eukprot:CAMPEP_0194533126 /NCGR_PEP_ID=MMETSP0253-20130528/70910_1 /TAXON_ID=2966 /ORGANISM="Noctiluca scintillans" /LENGTH=54 /DNA_ID=CAMNT_0039378649 /DNA_START=283 /DNA_END=447 /DNA_ORIENTATION=+
MKLSRDARASQGSRTSRRPVPSLPDAVAVEHIPSALRIALAEPDALCIDPLGII